VRPPHFRQVPTMSLLTSLSRTLEERLVRLWTIDARRALTRVLYEVYHADGRFSDDERAEFDGLAARLGTSASEIAGVDLAASLKLLEGDPKKRRVTYSWIAHALFADGTWSAEEKTFIDQIIAKYGLVEAELRAEIKLVQSRKVEEGMKAILDDIA
jgi:uncharacterized tellurite resistance protein B-like protein